MRFTKMQGVGNVFVVVGEEEACGQSLPELSLALCKDHFGVGADGLLAIGQGDTDTAFTFRMFNPDGTEDMCGNGLRCACLWAMRQGMVDRNSQDRFTVWTKEGPRACRILQAGAEGRQAQVEVDMGAPKLAPADIPALAPADLRELSHYPIEVAGANYQIDCANTGSTHTVLFGQTPPSDETFLKISPLIEHHPLFPERTSVLWAWPKAPDSFSVRIWERGAGETWGCGTGACAVAALAMHKGLVAGEIETVAIESFGGTLTISWPERGSILMAGPAQVVCDGELPPLGTNAGSQRS